MTGLNLATEQAEVNFDELHKIFTDKFSEDLTVTTSKYQKKLESRDQERVGLLEQIEQLNGVIVCLRSQMLELSNCSDKFAIELQHT